MVQAAIGIGTNLGDRLSYLAMARTGLMNLPETVFLAMADPIETDPVGPSGQGRYLNSAARIETTLAPAVLLGHLLAIEKRAGRDRSQDALRWGPRVLDLDLLLYGDQIIRAPDLHVPHPRMHERRFVLEPLVQIAPDQVHPVFGLTLIELFQKLLSSCVE